MSMRVAALAALALWGLGACGAPGALDAPAVGQAPSVSSDAQWASASFWSAWGDSRAEVAAYALTTPRYGELRRGSAVLITVTEPHDARTGIKDDRVQGANRVDVLKLNVIEDFSTGIYDYNLMTSVFAPVHSPRGGHRFSPAKMTFTAQEWCGHVYQQLRVRPDGFDDALRSYFASEGEREVSVETPANVLYEDALPLQIRELDGPFAEGGDWEGAVVPRMWTARRDHFDLAPRAARIARRATTWRGQPATEFALQMEGRGSPTRTWVVEDAPEKRILAWWTGDGERAELLGSERLPYWQLNAPEHEALLTRLGLPQPARPEAPEAPEALESPQ